MGFGRIGRDFYRLAQERDDLDIVVISDLGNPEILHYLLQVDGIEDDVVLEGNYFVSPVMRSRMISAVEPKDVPWDVFNVDVVVDATHRYVSREQMEAYISSGAPRVIISALPRDDIDRIVVMGVNDKEISQDDRLISGGSSTTQALALLLQILDKKFGVEKAQMTTVHAYTSDQLLQDTVGRDFRRSRSAAENIIPNDTPSPYWVGELIPHLKGKLDGLALNVPVPRGSCLDLTTLVNQDGVTIDDINTAVREAAAEYPQWVGVTDDPIVSSDVLGSTLSLLFDIKATMKSSKRMAKTLCWYDNGLGHAARILDIVLAYGKLDGKGGAQ